MIGRNALGNFAVGALIALNVGTVLRAGCFSCAYADAPKGHCTPGDPYGDLVEYEPDPITECGACIYAQQCLEGDVMQNEREVLTNDGQHCDLGQGIYSTEIAWHFVGWVGHDTVTSCDLG